MTSRLFKTISGTAVLSLALVSVGISGATAATTRTTPTCSASLVTSSKSVINITFWEGMPGGILAGDKGNEGVIQSLVSAFNTAEAGHIHVTDVNQPGGYTSTWNDYTASLSNHTSPNVMMFDQYDAQAANDTHSTLPVSTCITNNHDSVSTFNARVLDAYKNGTSIYGMPFSASVPVEYYNEKMFTAAGISSAPKTMAEVIADQKTLQKLTLNNGAGKPTKVKFGVSIKYDPWEITSWAGLSNVPIVNENNGHSGRATEATFGTNATLKSYLTDLQTIAKAGGGLNVYNPSSATISQSYGNLFDVGDGYSGITFDTTAALGTIMGFLGVYGNVKLGVAPLPTLTGKSTGGMPSGGNGLFINTSNSSAAQQAASWIFIQYLTSAANLATWDAQTGYLPIRSDEVSAWKTDLTAQARHFLQPSLPSWFEAGYASLAAGKTTTSSEGPLIGAYNQVNMDMQTALEGLLTSPFTTTPAQALTNAANNSTSDIRSYNSGL